MPLDPFTTTDNINSDNICKEILEKINLDHEPLTTSPPPLLSTSTLTSQPMHCMDSCLASEKQSNANRQLSRQNICSFMAQEIFPPSITVYSKYPYLHFALGVDTTTHPLQTVIAALSYHGNNHTHATTWRGIFSFTTHKNKFNALLSISDPWTITSSPTVGTTTLDSKILKTPWMHLSAAFQKHSCVNYYSNNLLAKPIVSLTPLGLKVTPGKLSNSTTIYSRKLSCYIGHRWPLQQIHGPDPNLPQMPKKAYITSVHAPWCPYTRVLSTQMPWGQPENPALFIT